MDKEKLNDAEAEILVTVMGIDDIFSQQVHARFSYSSEEILWNSRFKDIVSRGKDGKIRIDLQNMHTVETIE